MTTKVQKLENINEIDTLRGGVVILSEKFGELYLRSAVDFSIFGDGVVYTFLKRGEDKQSIVHIECRRRNIFLSKEGRLIFNNPHVYTEPLFPNFDSIFDSELKHEGI